MVVQKSLSEYHLSQQAQEFALQGDYFQAANLYDRAIAIEPDNQSNYWHLGLVLLLQGQEAEAQIAWSLGMASVEEETETLVQELVKVLVAEAQRREDLADYNLALTIRQHLQQIAPLEINNLLKVVILSIKLEKLTEEDFKSLDIIKFLQSNPLGVDTSLLMEVLQSMLDFAPIHPLSLEFGKACLAYVNKPNVFLNIVVAGAVKIAHSFLQPSLAAQWMELCLMIEEQNREVLTHLAAFYQNSHDYAKGIETAKLNYSLAQTLPDKIAANHLVIRGLMNSSSYWQEACSAFQQQQDLLEALIVDSPNDLDHVKTMRLVNSAYFQPYFQDRPEKNRQIQNKLVEIFQINTRQNLSDVCQHYQKRSSAIVLGESPANKAKIIKIGYLSRCLCRHSVGWLARGLFKHHNHQRFQINTYFINYRNNNDNLQEWYIKQSDMAYKGDIDGLAIAERIYQDEIDLLIDLDSLTLDTSCEIMALKPAPVQATWLGWDAIGMPAIDYFIADPYVLPKDAQQYYPETIWRLPQTYIAVDGFEVGVPTLRRDHLDIPSDAVVYLSAQRGYKRHPDTARLQMKIIKEVPNSYFLIKGLADEKAIEKFFNQLAEEEGVATDRLRFLGQEVLEETHRANLGIADIVLDTYPYNGATTTLETLWMGIPLVTRVGQQFAARNSYTMMVNAGISEGIAWTDEEYVEWGVRLGKDAALRQQIHWRLLQSRQTAPLWNAKQFARDMEKAYEQMWQHYLAQ